MNCKRQPQSFIGENSPAATAVLAMAIIFVLTFILLPPAQAQTYQVIHNFTGGQDGAYPEAGLTERGGNLYGTAYQGGGSNRGTVFKLARNGSGWIFSPLYSFTGGDRRKRSHCRSRVRAGRDDLRHHRIRRPQLRRRLWHGIPPEAAVISLQNRSVRVDGNRAVPVQWIQ